MAILRGPCSGAVRTDDFEMMDDTADRAAAPGSARSARRRAAEFDEDDEPARVRLRMRGGLLPKSRWGRIAAAGMMVVLLGMVTAGAISTRSLLMHDARFAVDSSEAIEIHGNAHVSREYLLAVFGGDLERNIFFIPLAERRAELERLPWIEHATVMRLLPDRLRVDVVERTPVAFVREGSKIGLVDASGVLLPMPEDEHYSFPVVTGVAASDPDSVRAARMKLYMAFLKEMDSSGQKVSEQLSEVDLSIPEDIKATIPESSGEVLVHFGDGDYLERYRKFEQHLPEWLTQYPKLASVDMRYDRQVVLEMQPGSDGAAAPAVAPANVGSGAELASAVPAVAPAPSPVAVAPKAAVGTHVPKGEGHGAPVVGGLKASVAAPKNVAAKKPVSAADAARAKRAAQTKAMLARGRVLKEQQAARSGPSQ